jgi:hypothetical protein
VERPDLPGPGERARLAEERLKLQAPFALTLRAIGIPFPERLCCPLPAHRRGLEFRLAESVSLPIWTVVGLLALAAVALLQYDSNSLRRLLPDEV